MAVRYALDTNVYIRVLRDPAARAAHRTFVMRHGLRLWLGGIVGMELRAGGRTSDQVSAVEAVIEPFAARERVFGVSFTSCHEAGRALADLALKERYVFGGASSSLVRDALLAVSCREA